jgi:hypothetical protein
MSLGFKLAIRGNFHKARVEYDKAVPIARTRIVQRKARQIHKRWKRDISRLRGGMLSATSFYGMAKAIRMGAPRKPELNPKSTNWSKAYRKDAKTGRIIDVIKVFEESRSINPRGSLYIPTDAAARLAGERFRRNVTPDMFKGQMIFLSRQGRRGTKGVLVHKSDISTVLFYVTGPVRLRKRFQSFQKTAKRIAANLPELTEKELHREFNKRLRRI